MRRIDWIGLLLSFEGIFSLIFFIIFVTAIVCIMYGAWWHIVTAVVSFAIFYKLASEMKQKMKNNGM